MQKSTKSSRPAVLTASVAVIFGSFFGAPATATEKTGALYWAETGVTYALIAKLVSSEKCAEPSHVQPCISALNAIAMQATDSAAVVSDSQLVAQPDAYATELKDFGPLKVVLSASADETSSVEHPIVHLRESTRLATAAAQAIAKSGAASTMDWNGIFAFVTQLPRAAGTDAFAAGMALNAYYGALLDPHTHFNPIAQNMDRMSGADNSFGGVGIGTQAIGGHIILGEPIEDGPSFKAGLFSGDEVIEIDGKPVLGQALESVVDRLRGPKGTEVTIKVKRAGENDPLEFKITRQTVTVKGVESKLVTTSKLKIGYIKLKSFMPTNSCDSVAAAITDALSMGASGLILDLRGNAGGLVNQGVCIGALFIGEDKVIVQVKDISQEGAPNQPAMKAYYAEAIASGGYQVFERQGKAVTARTATEAVHITHFPLTTLPTIVLTDSGSASASEIVAGALQDWAAKKNLPIWIAGDRSFGKATVQQVSDENLAQLIPELGPELAHVSGLALAKTVQRFYQPSGRTNQVVGIIPDFPILPKPDTKPYDNEALREEDLYTNAFPALGAPWTEPRPQQVSQISQCAAGGEAIARYTAGRRAQIPPDFRVLVASDLLVCISGQLPPVSTPLRIR